MGSTRGYVVGFCLSLVFTLGAYWLVTTRLDSPDAMPLALLLPAIIFLAVVQLIAQLIFFLHLSKESKPRWNIMALLFAVLVVVIVVFGSLWIMQHLDYHHAAPSSIDETILEDEGIE